MELRKRTTRRLIGEKWPTAPLHQANGHSRGSLCPKEVPNWRGKPAFSRRKSQETRKISLAGGEGGIRTPDTVARMPHFECGAFNHSATSPSGAGRGAIPAARRSLSEGRRLKQG